jgi:predicted AAA+ superfamily ATPase
VKSIKEYINYFEDVFLMQRIDKFHNKPKERITSAKKLYVLDNGFLTIAPKHSKNMGALLENLVFNTLYQNNRELAYLKERYEVDFYTHGNLYQVAYDISEPKTRKRELNAFEYFKKGVNGRCFLITNDVNEVIDKVEILSLERFLVDGV